MPQTHYQVLEVPATATQDQIRRAYRALAKKHHPDINPSKDAAKRFAIIAAAYEVLSSSEERRKYDQRLAAQVRERSASDFRQGHYAWVNVAAPRAKEPPDISEIDDLYETFFRPARPPRPAKSTPTQQAPNTRAKKPAPRRPRKG
jgi:DnaJ-class molecular chaperone